jgi:hypothetical protein
VVLRYHRWQAWTALAWLVGISWLAIEVQKPPPALGVDAPADIFSAGRAQAIVAAIAREPHPMGSTESKRVREVLGHSLKELGLAPQIQVPKDGSLPLRNVLARLGGQGPHGKKALLLCAHYDSVSTGPGAGDNASGVAVVLETLRALIAGPRLDRDVIALFDDGEENGLLGARLFVDEHPWAKEVGVVINFDARGNSGPSFMFETSDHNGWLIYQYAQAVSQPLATSVSTDIYRTMPNTTDLTIFKQAGMAGLNFAFSAGLAYYHTAEDTPENLNPRTLQHQGENALAMAHRLGRLDLDAPRGNDVIYSSILSRFVISYPTRWARPLSLVATLCFVTAISTGLWTRRVCLVDVATGAGLSLLAMCVSLCTLSLLFFSGYVGNIVGVTFRGVGIPWLKFDLPILTGCAIFTAVITLALKRWPAWERSFLALSAGALAWWVALALVTAFWLPGSSYLFAWPALLGALGLGVSIWAGPWSPAATIANLLCATPALVLLPPLVRNLFDALSLEAAAPGMILVVLFLGTTLPLLGPVIAPGSSSRKFPTVARPQLKVMQHP